jgi:hypothetical protein
MIIAEKQRFEEAITQTQTDFAELVQYGYDTIQTELDAA